MMKHKGRKQKFGAPAQRRYEAKVNRAKDCHYCLLLTDHKTSEDYVFELVGPRELKKQEVIDQLHQQEPQRKRHIVKAVCIGYADKPDELKLLAA